MRPPEDLVLAFRSWKRVWPEDGSLDQVISYRPLSRHDRQGKPLEISATFWLGLLLKYRISRWIDRARGLHQPNEDAAKASWRVLGDTLLFRFEQT